MASNSQEELIKVDSDLAAGLDSSAEASLVFIQADGEQVSVSVPDGQSVMDAAIENDIPGILGECGGSCACATCHVYIDEAWTDVVGPPGKIEKDMLEFAIDTKVGSRLGCRVKMSPELKGLIVRVPERQY